MTAVQDPLDLLPDRVLVCNCTKCRRILIGLGSVQWWKELNPDTKREPWFPRVTAARIDDKPYCLDCHPVFKALHRGHDASQAVTETPISSGSLPEKPVVRVFPYGSARK